MGPATPANAAQKIAIIHALGQIAGSNETNPVALAVVASLVSELNSGTGIDGYPQAVIQTLGKIAAAKDASGDVKTRVVKGLIAQVKSNQGLSAQATQAAFTQIEVIAHNSDSGPFMKETVKQLGEIQITAANHKLIPDAIDRLNKTIAQRADAAAPPAPVAAAKPEAAKADAKTEAKASEATEKKDDESVKATDLPQAKRAGFIRRFIGKHPLMVLILLAFGIYAGYGYISRLRGPQDTAPAPPAQVHPDAGVSDGGAAPAPDAGSAAPSSSAKPRKHNQGSTPTAPKGKTMDQLLNED
jgi:hypothetical protein